MSTLHIAWIKASGGNSGGDPSGFIRNLVSSELVTTSGTSAQSAAAPANADYAICTAVDANHYITEGASNPTAASTNSVVAMTGGFHVLRVQPGQKIAAKTF